MTFRPLFAAAVVAAVAGPAWAGSIENLERERAIAIETLLAPEMAASERSAKISVAKSRLVDLERIALRDKSVDGRASPAIKRAFANYDLTFLVHASTEKNVTLLDHWLEELGLSTQNLMAASRRRR